MSRNHFPILRNLTLEVVASRAPGGVSAVVWGVMYQDHLLGILEPGDGASPLIDSIMRPPGSQIVTGIDTTWSTHAFEFTTMGKRPDLRSGKFTRGRAWQPGDVPGLRIGFGASVAGGDLRITQLRVLVKSVNDFPEQLSYVRYYRTLTPDPPNENAAPLGTPAGGLVGWSDPDFPTESAALPVGTLLYYWARAYDLRRVPSALVGPTEALVIG